jgi:sentrin-specific protease 1
VGSPGSPAESTLKLPDSEAVNSLKDRFSNRSVYQAAHEQKIIKSYDEQSQRRRELIQEEERKNREICSATKEHERSISDKFRDFHITSRVFVVDEEEEEVIDEFPALTQDQLNKIVYAVRGGGMGEVIINKFNLSITRQDLNTLVGDSWLNDEVINFYMNLLMERSDEGQERGRPRVYAMNTFFIPRLLQTGHSALKRWTRKVDIFSYDVIPVPVHVGQVHWCMAIIHLKNKTIKYYDSMGHPNYRVLDALEQYLKDESMDKKKVDFDMAGWSKECVRECPRQMNGSDCGVFSCMFAEFICRDSDISFAQQHMQYFRNKMIYEIATGKLILQ